MRLSSCIAFAFTLSLSPNFFELLRPPSRNPLALTRPASIRPRGRKQRVRDQYVIRADYVIPERVRSLRQSRGDSKSCAREPDLDPLAPGSSVPLSRPCLGRLR